MMYQCKHRPIATQWHTGSCSATQNLSGFNLLQVSACVRILCLCVLGACVCARACVRATLSLIYLETGYVWPTLPDSPALLANRRAAAARCIISERCRLLVLERDFGTCRCLIYAVCLVWFRSWTITQLKEGKTHLLLPPGGVEGLGDGAGGWGGFEVEPQQNNALRCAGPLRLRLPKCLSCVGGAAGNKIELPQSPSLNHRRRWSTVI